MFIIRDFKFENNPFSSVHRIFENNVAVHTFFVGYLLLYLGTVYNFNNASKICIYIYPHSCQQLKIFQ